MRKISKLPPEAMKLDMEQMETLWNCLFSSKICYFSSLFSVKSVPLISNHIFALYTQQNFLSVTVFQIKLLRFQEKCNKCLNRSKVKLMRGRKKKKKPTTFLLLYCYCFLSASQLGDAFTPGIVKGPFTKQEGSGNTQRCLNLDLLKSSDKCWFQANKGSWGISLQTLDGAA